MGRISADQINRTERYGSYGNKGDDSAQPGHGTLIMGYPVDLHDADVG